MTGQPPILYRVEGAGASLSELLDDLDDQARLLFGHGKFRMLGAVTVEREAGEMYTTAVTYTGTADYVNEAWR